MLCLLILRSHYVTLHQLVSKPSNFPTMTQRRHDGGNKYASLGVMHEREETSRDEPLVICLEQHMEERFANVFEQIRKRMDALVDAQIEKLIEQFGQKYHKNAFSIVQIAPWRQDNPFHVKTTDTVSSPTFLTLADNASTSR